MMLCPLIHLITQPFTHNSIDVSQAPDFPTSHIREFNDTVGPLTLVYRNIRDLCELLFSHPAFAETMILKPKVYMKSGRRVYKGLDSGRWWEELQVCMVSLMKK